jgi:hypothetical protein
MGEYFRLYTHTTFWDNNMGPSRTLSTLQNGWRELEQIKSNRSVTAASTWEWESPVSAGIYQFTICLVAMEWTSHLAQMVNLVYKEPDLYQRSRNILNATHQNLSPIIGRMIYLTVTVLVLYCIIDFLTDVKRDFTFTFTLHSLDPRLIKMTVGCGISHTNTKTHIRYNWSIPKVLTHTNKSILSTYTMYTTH